MYNRNKTVKNHIQLKKDAAKLTYLIKQEKNKEWERTVDKIDSNTSTSELWRTVRRLKGAKGPDQEPNVISSSRSKAADFLKANFNTANSKTRVSTTPFSTARISVKDSINTVLHQSLRRATGCTKTTPINTIMSIAAEVPFPK